MNKELIGFFTENSNAITFILSIDGLVSFKSNFQNKTYKFKVIGGIDESYFLYYDENHNIESIRKFNSNLTFKINQQDIDLICKCKNFCRNQNEII